VERSGDRWGASGDERRVARIRAADRTSGHHLVHVEDVATAHVKALFDSKTNGLRIMLAESSLWVKDVCNILREAGFNKAPKRELPNLIVKFAALFDQELAGIKDFLGQARHSKSKKAQELLGLYSKTAQEAILETANDLTKKKA